MGRIDPGRRQAKHQVKGLALLALNHATRRGPFASDQHRTTRPHSKPDSSASLHRPAKVGHGETLFAAISGDGRGGSDWAKAGATGQAMASNRHTAPGKGATKSTGKATRSAKAWDRVGKKKGAVCM